MNRNIFRSLFTYRSREGRSPKENYLTEAFAHALQESPDDCRAWLAQVLGLPVGSIGKQIHVETQVSLASDDGAARAVIDMVIHAQAGGAQATVLCEHKWDSPTSGEWYRDHQPPVRWPYREGRTLR
ncbi:MAG: hypothetical protein HY744_07340 [Deltaproteobacteria bacterium]|nr:hypothetical protein [Deltaproteobacteria bacterium]